VFSSGFWGALLVGRKAGRGRVGIVWRAFPWGGAGASGMGVVVSVVSVVSAVLVLGLVRSVERVQGCWRGGCASSPELEGRYRCGETETGRSGGIARGGRFRGTPSFGDMPSGLREAPWWTRKGRSIKRRKPARGVGRVGGARRTTLCRREPVKAVGRTLKPGTTSLPAAGGGTVSGRLWRRGRLRRLR